MPSFKSRNLVCSEQLCTPGSIPSHFSPRCGTQASQAGRPIHLQHQEPPGKLPPWELSWLLPWVRGEPWEARPLISTPPPGISTPEGTNPCLSSHWVAHHRLQNAEFLFHRGVVARMESEMIGRGLGTVLVETWREELTVRKELHLMESILKKQRDKKQSEENTLNGENCNNKKVGNRKR